MIITYTIDENNVLTFTNSTGHEFFVQERWPIGTEWTTEEATAWADCFVAYYADVNATVKPGSSPEEPTHDIDAELDKLERSWLHNQSDA